MIGPIAQLMEHGAALPEVLTILRSEARRPRKKPIRTWQLWAKIVAEQLAPTASSPQLVDNPGDPRLDFGGGHSAPLSTIRLEIAKGRWNDSWVPKLGEPGCRIPEPYWPELRNLAPRGEVDGEAA